MRESELLDHIYRRSADLAARYPAVVLGPGDDCAVVRVGQGAAAHHLLITVDQLVEGRHFGPETPVDLIARKAVARSISDIAAMAGTPAWALAAGALPEGYQRADELFEALHRWARHFGAPLVGGDIATAPRGSALVLAVTVGGTPGPGRGPITRAGARIGDEVWVTGRFGGSLTSGRHLSFEPRLREAAWVRDSLAGDLHAMIDVSDGLGRDAGRIAKASGARIEIDMDRLPRHAGVSDPIEALSHGEDYELCLAAAPGRLERARPQAGLAEFTRIGRVVAGSGCVALDAQGSPIDASNLGWDHGAER